MDANRMILRTQPTDGVDSPKIDPVSPTSWSTRIYQSLPELISSSSSPADDRQTLFIEIKLGSQRPCVPPPRIQQEAPAESSSADGIFSECLAAGEPPTQPWQAAQQKALQAIGLEFRRLTQQVQTEGRIRAFQQKIHELSARQLDVLVLMIQGQSCKEVAARLDVGLATAAKHRARVLKTLCVRNSIEMVHLLCALFDQRVPMLENQ